MGKRPTCKARNCKTLHGGHRQNSDINGSKILFDPPPKVMEIKKISGTSLNLKAFAEQRKL